ncbi:Uncharacterised protein [Mycobacteroides abscessus subsp. abscessus]|uniref:hypothetical protein n=1 Tax=Mycobacteroides abscessus TaxID=36809 RepID=UPI0005A53D97|nr:hypothetical protein [Mycobacteroides abscessus]RIU09618.1 hypothetical protein D2E94_10920 [Mycobacteroides abscessus]SHU65240.1 Uncharacterised protein [Mycobacteroides abscessus subsp. abscessus]SKT17061.1 Uncharacterised protein [Mycobacteroides abscessus subsp. abscessus]SLF57421.1 Uncharacterised protein [Mycobacteroides abscessus subsp. abscessus]BBZ81847.1 hypothetical protein MABM_17630 [Mycobacteroides abscessus]
MSGRERIEQAAKENGWAVRRVGGQSALEFSKKGELLFVGFDRAMRHVMFADVDTFFTTHMTEPPEAIADQVIAYLQQGEVRS